MKNSGEHLRSLFNDENGNVLDRKNCLAKKHNEFRQKEKKIILDVLYNFKDNKMLKKSDRFWAAGFLLILAGFIFACGGGANSNKQSEASDYEPTQSSDEDWEPNESNTESSLPTNTTTIIAQGLADAMFEGELTFINRRGGSVGLLSSFTVMTIVDSSTIQVNLSGPNNYDPEVGFITNVNASGYRTGNYRYQIYNPVIFTHNQTYTNVLGSVNNSPVYRVYSDSEVAEAERLIAEKERALAHEAEVDRQAEVQLQVRINQREELLMLISRMRQNARTVTDYESVTRKQVSAAVTNTLATMNAEQWTGQQAIEYTAIIEELKQCNILYQSDNPDGQSLMDRLADLLNRARAMNPQIP